MTDVTIERNPKPFATCRFADGDQVAVTIVGTWRTEQGEHCGTEWMEGPFGRPLFTEGRAYMDAEKFELRDGSPPALQAAQDEIERRISECESHRVLVDAVLAEREAELQCSAWLDHLTWALFRVGSLLGNELAIAAKLYRAECAGHRRAVADSIGGA